MDYQQFFFSENSSLANYPTYFDADKSEKELKKIRDKARERISDLQEKLFAESKQSILFVLQAMDAAGKDSTIAKLTANMNVQGSHVTSFKKPSKLEMAHDFLWRIHQHAPAQGEISIFNRSHYEDVLIVKVHQWASEEQIQNRYQHIVNFESLLADRGTRVVKIMLNISPEYQLQRFQSRLENQEKNWKFNPGDLDERALWSDYMNAFELALQKTSTSSRPWYVIPAENRDFRDAVIASIMADTLEEMAPQYPQPDYDSDQYTVDNIS